MLYVEVISGLWIGDIDVMYNKKFIEDNNITIILNCTINFKFSDYPNINNIRLPLSDNLYNNLEQLRTHKDKILKFIDDSLQDNNIVIVCYDGKTISPFIIFKSMKYGDITKIS